MKKTNSIKNEIYIGENLDIFNSRDFQKYKNQVDFIYIDPPYNTNKKTFTYNDNNKEWTQDIEKRLIFAKSLLKNDGCIFISIDDNELSNLIHIGKKIFEPKNYVGIFITKQAQRSNTVHINIIHEYIVCFAKNKKELDRFYINRLKNPFEKDKIEKIILNTKHNFKKHGLEYAKNKLNVYIKQYILETGETWIKNYSNIDNNGEIFFAKDLSAPGEPNEINIPEINIHLAPLKTRAWSSPSKIKELYINNRLSWKKNRPYEITYLNEAQDNIRSILNFYSRQGTNDLKKLGLENIFDTPKPVELIKFLIRCSQHKSSLILDFYAGSGTTAQAVYEINKEDNVNHKYILIQKPEEISINSKAYNILLNKFNIKNPTMDKMLLLRINTVIKKNKIKKDYILNYAKQ